MQEMVPKTLQYCYQNPCPQRSGGGVGGGSVFINKSNVKCPKFARRRPWWNLYLTATSAADCYIFSLFAEPIWRAWTNEMNLQLPAGTHVNSFLAALHLPLARNSFYSNSACAFVVLAYVCNELFVGNFIWGVPYMPCGTKLNSNENATLTPDNLDYTTL